MPSFLWIFTEAVLPSRKAAVICSISSLVAAVFEARVALLAQFPARIGGADVVVVHARILCCGLRFRVLRKTGVR